MTKPGRVVEAALLALLLLTCALRFRGLDHDLPYGLVSLSGSFVTDEGGYSKAAILWIRHGRWVNPDDFNTFTHNVLYSVVTAAAFRLFGVGLETARAVSVLAFLASMAMLYLFARGAGQPRAVALLACLAAGTALSGVTFSRMAIVEPLGVAVSLAALLLWVRWPDHRACCVASLLLGAGALFVKTSFVFTLIAVVLLWLGDGLRRKLVRAESRLGWRLASVAAVLLLSFLAARAIRQHWPEAWQAFQSRSVGEVTRSASQPLDVLRSELEWTRYTLHKSDYRVMAWVLVLATVFLTARHRRRLVLLPLGGRAALALALWGGGGFVMFAMFEKSEPRYFYFLLFPLALLATQAVGALAGEKRRLPAAAVLVLLHCGAQLGDYSAWWRRGPSSSYADAGRKVAARVSEQGPSVLLGVSSSFVAYFDDRILPVDSGFADEEELCRRVERWRPGFVVHFVSAMPALDEACSVVDRVEPMERYRVMDGYYYHSDMVVARLVYLRTPSRSRTKAGSLPRLPSPGRP